MWSQSQRSNSPLAKPKSLSLAGMFFNPSSVLWQESYQEGFRPVTGQARLNQSSYSSNSSFILWISNLPPLSVWPHKLVSPCCLSLAFVLHKCASEQGESGQHRNSFNSKFLIIQFIHVSSSWGRVGGGGGSEYFNTTLTSTGKMDELLSPLRNLQLVSWLTFINHLSEGGWQWMTNTILFE